MLLHNSFLQYLCQKIGSCFCVNLIIVITDTPVNLYGSLPRTVVYTSSFHGDSACGFMTCWSLASNS